MFGSLLPLSACCAYHTFLIWKMSLYTYSLACCVHTFVSSKTHSLIWMLSHDYIRPRYFLRGPFRVCDPVLPLLPQCRSVDLLQSTQASRLLLRTEGLFPWITLVGLYTTLAGGIGRLNDLFLGECKQKMTLYMNCLKENGSTSSPCRILSRDYLDCRMQK